MNEVRAQTGHARVAGARDSTNNNIPGFPIQPLREATTATRCAQQALRNTAFRLSDDSFPHMIVSEYGIAIGDTYLDPAYPQTTLSWTHPSFAGDMDLNSHTAATLMRYRYGIS